LDRYLAPHPPSPSRTVARRPGAGEAASAGIAKKIARGRQLLPGIANRYLPQDVGAHLPPPPSGAERIIVSDHVVLIKIGTGVMLDIRRWQFRSRRLTRP
jgi:hypothetical protein